MSSVEWIYSLLWEIDLYFSVFCFEVHDCLDKSEKKFDNVAQRVVDGWLSARHSALFYSWTATDSNSLVSTLRQLDECCLNSIMDFCSDIANPRIRQIRNRNLFFVCAKLPPEISSDDLKTFCEKTYATRCCLNNSSCDIYLLNLNLSYLRKIGDVARMFHSLSTVVWSVGSVV